MRGNLAAISEYPERLPFEVRFDLIFAFSVFTHLSLKAHRQALKVLADAITDEGLLVLTIRPREYWLMTGQRDAATRISEHDNYNLTDPGQVIVFLRRKRPRETPSVLVPEET